MIAIYNFNENDATNVYDYSGNGNVVSAITGFSVVDGDLGKAGVFDGSTTELDFGNIADIGGTDRLDIFIEQNLTTSQEGVLVFKSQHFQVRINASDKVVFKVYIGGAEQTLTGTVSISTGSYETIACIYNGINQYIYIDGVLDNSRAQTGNLVGSSANLFIGTDQTDYYDGNIQHIEINAVGYTAANVVARNNAATGIKYEHVKATGYALGDLLENEPTAIATIQGVVTYIVDIKTAYIFPIAGKFDIGQSPIRRGNIGVDTTRQWISEMVIISNSPTWQIKDGVDTFAKAALASTAVFKNTKDGLEHKSTTIGKGTKQDGWKTRDGVEVQTTDATQTTTDSITLEDENTYMISAYVVGVKSDGSQRASYHIECTAYRTGGGSATLQGAVTSVHAQESDAAWNATFTVSSRDVRVSVTGVAATTIEWMCSLRYVNMSN